MYRLITLMGFLSFALAESASGQMGVASDGDLLDGEFWRAQVVDELVPLWYDRVRDVEHGAFYMNLSRDWQPRPPWNKVPAMISRQVFSFSAAYLLSGEEKYLQVAREGVEYLLEHAWDAEYGAWFDELTQAGEPANASKSVALQLYTNVGLSLYYFATGDERVLSYVEKSIEIRRRRARDPEFGGYYQVLNRDLSVRDEGKNKHSHYGYVGSLLLNLYLAAREPEILAFEKELTDLSLAHMMEGGWIYGFGSHFDRRWRRTPALREDVEVAAVGAQLTAALSFLRLYHQSGEEEYLKQGKALGDRVSRWGWDARKGGWLDYVGSQPPHRPPAGAQVSWWIQIYGAFLQLQLYHLTQDEAYLERFRKSERFFVDHMLDREFGGVFSTVSPRGERVDEGRKASVWHTSYHEVEHGLLNYLYLNLYVHHRPVVLYFELGEGAKKHYVSLVDDPAIEIAGVEIDGRTWAGFDARERSVTLPGGEGLRLRVELRAKNPSGHRERGEKE